MNETFWDAQNLEIEACANFGDFSGSGNNFHPGKSYGDWMLWVHTPRKSVTPGRRTFPGIPIVIKKCELHCFWKWAFFYENRARPNLDAMSVPETLTKTILHHFAQLSRIKHP